MNPESIVTAVIAVSGMTISWAGWVSVSVFKHAQEIALLKQEIKLMEEIKNVLGRIDKHLGEHYRL